MRDERPARYRGERVPTASNGSFPSPQQSDREAAQQFTRRKAAERLLAARAEAHARAYVSARTR